MRTIRRGVSCRAAAASLRSVGSGVASRRTREPIAIGLAMLGPLRFAHPTICNYFSTANVRPA